MKVAPLHPEEEKRLNALKRLEILDTDDDKVFDELTELASEICGTSISLISLIDAHRQWFKSRVGLEATETSRSIAFCSHAILEDHVLEVSDALQDERFSDNPLVLGSPDIRFYAGAPLIASDGSPVGTLCVIDQKPHKLKPNQIRALEILANQVMTQMELRLQYRLQKQLENEREKLFGVIAHDLKSPFNGILNFTKLLWKNAGSWPVEKIQKVSSTILESSIEGYQILEELLAWSQKRMGVLRNEPEAISVKALYNLIPSHQLDAMQLKKITLFTGGSDHLPALVDITLTKTIIRNLLSNAIKYTPEEGRITISAKQDGQFVVVSVEDTGAGVPDEIKDKLFKASVNSQAGTSDELGHGLGLMLCHEFAIMQGGDLYVDDHYSGGTRICLRLPMASTNG
jgi:signal transduction histidine kinase